MFTEDIVEFIPLVSMIAHRMMILFPSHVEVGDLINDGVIGLMDAAEKFDSSRETKFKTYAEFRIRGAILDELRSRAWIPRSVRRKINLLSDTYASLEQTLGRPAEDEEMARALNLKLCEFHEMLRRAGGVSLISLDELTENIGEDGRSFRENVIAHSQGDDLLTEFHAQEIKRILAQAIDELSPKERTVISLYYYEELTMKQIGEVMEVTESWISQLHTKAILRLRGKFRRKIGESER